ncbi:MAG: AraC family transcriptional regulator [Acidobacteria bacterium]|nr:MAG: AraC family transcriptional regulator [Acidobacteriota bacterium]
MDHRVQLVLDALDTGWRQELRIRDLARKAGVSPTWLQRLFKQEVGVTIREYVYEGRDKKGCDGLRIDQNRPGRW